MFTNPDLTLLDDFFRSIGKIYKCNITGFQLVHHDPMMKASLALTMDAVTVVGTALKSLHAHGNMPVPEAILCEADDAWVDGDLFAEAVKQVSFDEGTTGVIRFDDRGQRRNISLKGITRTGGKFRKVGFCLFYYLLETEIKKRFDKNGVCDRKIGFTLINLPI
uniref:ANF_receptor domain-containing protein n=1 Tax=Panagrellus redivivus TaxID=6233 RepID=A0A7E4W6S5_PANRE